MWNGPLEWNDNKIATNHIDQTGLSKDQTGLSGSLKLNGFGGSIINSAIVLLLLYHSSATSDTMYDL